MNWAAQASKLVDDGVLSAESIYLTAVGQYAPSNPGYDTEAMASMYIVLELDRV